MNVGTSKQMILALVAFGAIGPMALAVTLTWDNPCSTEGGLEPVFNRTWCEGDWDDTARWGGSGYPDGGFDNAILESDNNQAASNGGWLQVNLIAESINALTIRAKAEAGTNLLKLAFWEDFTLTCKSISIDGSNGAVTIIAGDGAKVETACLAC